MTSDIAWLAGLKSNVVGFLSRLRGREMGGYFKYSLTGDLVDERYHWGLGNAVFAAKILYMTNALTDHDRNVIAEFIQSFQDPDGHIFDPMVWKKSRWARLKIRLTSCFLKDVRGEQMMRAETRQAFAALRCLGAKPRDPFMRIPKKKDEITRYVHALNWQDPWSAASHVSHLLFFLHANHTFYAANQSYAPDLIEHGLLAANTYQQPDGAWYKTGADVPVFQKINGAMKMMMAYASCERTDFLRAEKLIDLCLSAVNDGHACNNLNIICVLYHCSKKTEHRKDEIRCYCIERLKLYEKHYWPEYGGFSFFEGRANDVYYGARISRGLPEPDIHGTVLFLWGIAMISEICGLGDTISLKMPIT